MDGERGGRERGEQVGERQSEIREMGADVAEAGGSGRTRLALTEVGLERTGG